MTGYMTNRMLLGVSAVVLAAVPVPVMAQAQTYRFDLPAQSLDASLRAFARTTRQQILFDGALVRGKKAPALKGAFSAEQGLSVLLRGSGLVATRGRGGAWVVSVVGNGASTEGGTAEPPSETAAESAEIVVTGSSIRGATPPGANVVTIDRRAIDESGYATTQQILQSIPQAYGGGSNEGTAGATGSNGANLNASLGSTINLRGLGTSSTLVLINGSRPGLGGLAGNFADISMIPVSAIDQIEVLADGASAIYGSDAVAGVVNIRTRRGFAGLETSLRYGTADGDFDELQVSQLAGAKWGSGNIVLAGEFNRRGALAASKRGFATQDLRPFGGGDFRSQFANPGTIVAGGGTYAVPSGQDGTALSPTDLVRGTLNLQDGWDNADLLPKQTRYSAYARVEQDIGEGLTFDMEGLYARREFERRANPSGSQSTFVVTPANPYYVDPVGTGQQVSVRYDFTDDLGPRTDIGHVTAIGANAGAKLRRGPWAIDLRGTFGRQSEKFGTINIPNSARLRLASASGDVATAFNPFGDGSNSSQSVLDYIRGSTWSNGRSTIWSGSAKADGPLFELPGGQSRLALGYEHRDEHFERETISDQSSLTPTISNFGPVGHRRIDAYFGEIIAPIIGENNGVPGIRSLTLSAALRHERYNDFGGTTNPKFGLSWLVADGLKLRGSFGTSFRAPGFADLIQSDTSNVSFITTLADPTSSTGTSTVLFIRGNKLGMMPEKARTLTLGTDLEPAFAPGLRVSATYYDIRYKDRIVDLTSVLLQMLTNRPTYAALITDAPSLALIQGYMNSPGYLDFGFTAADVDVFIDGQTQNLAVLRQKGIDFDVQYRRPMAGGTMRAEVDGTYILKLSQAASASAPYGKLLNTINNPVSLRMRGLLGWSDDAWSFSAQANYVGGYTNTIPIPSERIKSWTTVDAQVGYRFSGEKGPLAGLRLALSATNLFDRDPPYAAFSFNGITAIGYDPQNASPVGRVVSLQLTKSW